MEQQYKVISGACPGIRKVFKRGDIITALDVRNISEVIRGKFVVELTAAESVALPVSLEVAAPVVDDLMGISLPGDVVPEDAPEVKQPGELKEKNPKKFNK